MLLPSAASQSYPLPSGRGCPYQGSRPGDAAHRACQLCVCGWVGGCVQRVGDTCQPYKCAIISTRGKLIRNIFLTRKVAR